MKNNNTNIGISGTTLLQIVFIVLKLCGVINWSWGWVLAPLWMTTAVVVIVLVVFFIWVHMKERL